MVRAAKLERMIISTARSLALLVAVICVTFTSGCSSTRLAYNNADWYLVREIDKYICTNSRQKEELERMVKGFFAWHRRHELPRYARALRKIAGAVKRKPVTHKLLLEIYDTLDGARVRATNHLKGPLVAFGMTLGRKQASCIAVKLAAGRRERVDELKGSPAAYRARHLKKMEDRLEPWLGDLDAKQRHLLAAMLPSQSHARAAARARFRKGLRFIAALTSPKPKEKRTWLGSWVTDPYALYATKERQLLKGRETRNKRQIWPLARSLSKNQRTRFADKVLEYALDFEALAAKK
jgi:hypothetical protein